MTRAATLFTAALWVSVTNAHLAAWHQGMYCINGPQSAQDLNSQAIVQPLWQLSFNDWWFHGFDGCNQYPPADGDILELPAGGSFTVEIASNRAKTTLSYNGRDTSEWPDGATYPEDYNVPSCITSPNMHTQNQSMAAGTAFAISYQSDITKVTPQNLVVFTVRYNTPWKRVVNYDVPAAMPACPSGGCICAWGWVPNGCGEPNMYHQAFKCKVTGASGTTAIGTPKAPVWCEGNSGACTKGPKQMIYWNQAEGDNISVDGFDLAGDHKSPAYNSKLGFPDGAQNDIFTGSSSSSSSSSGSSSGSGSGSSSSSSGSSSSGSSGSSPSSGGSGTPASSGSGSGSGSSSGSSSASASASASAAGSTASASSGLNRTNPAPSCKKRTRRSLAGVAGAGEGVSVHRRHHPHARRGW